MNSYFVKQPLFDGYTLYLVRTFCNPEVVEKFVRNLAIDCVSLFSTQEEADIRIMLHASHANKLLEFFDVRGRIVFRCSDTDAMVLSIDAAHNRAVVIHGGLYLVVNMVGDISMFTICVYF